MKSSKEFRPRPPKQEQPMKDNDWVDKDIQAQRFLRKNPEGLVKIPLTILDKIKV